ncbi:hypothetical protein OSTOST_21500 [Ostertagia ostertagi]
MSTAISKGVVLSTEQCTHENQERVNIGVEAGLVCFIDTICAIAFFCFCHCYTMCDVLPVPTWRWSCISYILKAELLRRHPDQPGNLFFHVDIRSFVRDG